MNIEFRKLLMLCACAWVWIQSANAQLTDWQYASVIEITEQQGATFTNEQVLVTINTAALVASGQMQVSGADMRFATDCEGNNLIDYYIESGMNTAATKVWLRVPLIAPNNTTTIYFFSGNPLAVPGTDFSNTFPNTLIINANTVLFGVLDYDWFEIQPGVTVTLLANSPLDITSNKIIIDGTIDGSGMGLSGGAAGSGNGNGPGGGIGALTPNDGAGGGGYGATGGNGGNTGIFLYVGGSPYGSQTDGTSPMGSGGGGTMGFAGGNGGGSVALRGVDVEISGIINVEGADGTADLANVHGAGGGSGGSALASGRFLVVTGTVTARGGDGGTDVNPLFGGGGGGAGGRVKAFYSNTGNLSGAIDVTGGTGGCCGAVPSQSGGAGTTHQELTADIYSININPLIQRQSPAVSGAANTCVGTTETYSASVIPGDSYLWSAFGGTVVGGQGTNIVQINWTVPGSDTVFLITSNLFLGCSDTVAYPVAVSATLPVANFGFSIACAGSATVFTDSSTVASGTIVSYAWDFGDGNTSSTQSPQHTYATAGTYTAILEVTADNGCTDTVSKSVTVEDFLDAGFTATTVCRNDTTVFTPNSLVGFSYNWDFGDGSSSIVVSPTHVYASAGTFFATLTITSTGGCVSTETHSVIVNATPVIDFEFASACPNEDVVFTNLTSVASGSLTYAWDFGDSGSSGAEDPVHPYTGEGNYMVKLVATSNGCSDSITKSVAVFPQPVADFGVSVGCAGTVTQFTDASGISSGFLIYSWNFGDLSLLSNDNNPTHVYATDGTYPVTLIVTSDKGCVDTITGTAVVYEQPTASFTATTECLGDSTRFTNTSSSGPGISYFWTFGDGNFSTDANPVYVYGTAGDYQVDLDVTTSDGCVASAQQTVTVSNAPVASFTAPVVCSGTATQFFNTSTISGGGTVNFNWDFGDSGSSTLDNPLHVYAVADTFTVTLIAVSGANCADTTTSTVIVKQQPSADFDISAGCFGSDVLIIDLSTAADSGAYYQVDLFNDGIYDNGPYAAGDTASVNVAFTGSVPVRIRLTNFSGCVDSTVEVLSVSAFPVAGFTASDACLGAVVSFTNTTTSNDPNLLGSVGYQWIFGDGDTTTDINPTHVYDSSGIYTVILVAVSSDGCSDTATNTLIVYPLAVPDFTHAPACDDQDVIFTNTSTIDFGTMTHHWDFGDGTTADTTDPTHRFPGIGVFQVTLTDTSDAGCVSSITKSVVVNANPTSNFIATEVCEGTPTEFTNMSSIASGTLTYVWDFGDSFNGVDEDPDHPYASDGDYDVVLVVTSDMGCTDSKSRTVTVLAKPDVAFTATNTCEGGVVTFTNNTTVPAGNILFNIWNFGDGANSFDDNTSHIYDTYGTYSVKLFVQSEDGCSDSLLQAVIVYRQPNVLITHNGPLAFCDGDEVTLAALPFPVTNTYTYLWSNASTDSAIVVSTSGTFCVTVTDQNGCSDDTCEVVEMWVSPVATASASADSISKGLPVQLFATGGTTYQWSADPQDPTLDPGAQNPVVVPEVTTTYTVTVTDANGCTGTATVTVGVVDDYFVDATNVITPNGDPYNQNWVVQNILTYPDNEVLIFDRWGTLVFQQKAYDNTWDGTHDGKDLPQGTYYYVIRFDNSEKVQKGSVSIVR